MLIKRATVESIQDIKFSKDDAVDTITTPLSKKSKEYVNGKSLYEEFRQYYFRKLYWIISGKKGTPPLNNAIGKAILQICVRRCNSPQYVKYTNAWKEEMIGNAIEKAITRSHNFDPYRLNADGINTKNAFSYITQIADNAIKEHLNKEKRVLYIKYKSMDNAGGFNADDSDDDSIREDHTDIGHNDRLAFIGAYEDKHIKKRKPHEVKQVEQDEIITVV